MIRSIFLLFFISVSFTIEAQQPVSIHLTEKEGVPDNEFYNVIEDDNGVIWLAASKGLFKYDGATFKTFTHPDQIGLSVFQLKKDNDNAIWFTNTANQFFFIKDDKVTLFTDLKNEFKGELTTMSIVNNLIILFTRHKVIFLDRKTANILCIKKTESNNSSYLANYIEPYVFNNEAYFGDIYNTFNKGKTNTTSLTFSNVIFYLIKTLIN